MSNPPAIGADAISITQLFPTPLASTVHPDAARLNAALSAAILAQEAACPGVQHSNQKGWQSSDDFHIWGGDAAAELIGFMMQFANTLSAVWDPDRGLLQADLRWTFNAWANVNRAGHSNAQHAHPGAYWSGVYWVDDGQDGEDVDPGGELEFIDPRGAMPAMLSPDLKMRIHGCLSAGLRHRIRPSSGTLVMFPSWLMHAVTEFTGARPRISIAINLVPPLR